MLYLSHQRIDFVEFLFVRQGGGNMTDSYGMESSNTNLAVIRAVNNENIARDKLNMNQRTKHGGKEINPKELIK